MLFGLILAVHIVICFAMVLVILLQSGKGGGLAGAFGGGGSTIFGGRGAGTVLTRATMILGALFFVTSLTLAMMSTPQNSGAGRSLIQEEARKASGTQPTSGPSGSTPLAPSSPTAPQTPDGSAPGATPSNPPAGQQQPAPTPQGGSR